MGLVLGTSMRSVENICGDHFLMCFVSVVVALFPNRSHVFSPLHRINVKGVTWFQILSSLSYKPLGPMSKMTASTPLRALPQNGKLQAKCSLAVTCEMERSGGTFFLFSRFTSYSVLQLLLQGAPIGEVTGCMSAVGLCAGPTVEAR